MAKNLKIKKALDDIKAEFEKPIPVHSTKEEKKMTESKTKKKAPAKAKAAPKAKKPVKATKTKAAPKPTGNKEVITLAGLAEEASITPAQARQKLRAAKVEREDGKRWEWTKSSRQLKTVRKALGLK